MDKKSKSGYNKLVQEITEKINYNVGEVERLKAGHINFPKSETVAKNLFERRQSLIDLIDARRALYSKHGDLTKGKADAEELVKLFASQHGMIKADLVRMSSSEYSDFTKIFFLLQVLYT